MKKIRLAIIALSAFISMGVRAQALDLLTSACYKALEQEDTITFNQTYPLLFDAFARENDDMYAITLTLQKVHNSDQSIRILLNDIYKDMDGKGKYLSKVRQLMRDIDQKNVSIVTQIIDKYGWLSKDDIGEDANETLFLCIQHCQDSIIQYKYLPIIKEAVDQGRAEPWHFAFLTDRVRMNEGLPQIYGTQTIKSNGRTYPVPLEDPHAVDDLRRKIGLESLNEYMQGFGESFSVDNYLKSEPAIRQCFKDWQEKKH